MYWTKYFVVLVMACGSSVASHQKSNFEEVYTESQLYCVSKSKTREESRACRDQRDFQVAQLLDDPDEAPGIERARKAADDAEKVKFGE